MTELSRLETATQKWIVQKVAPGGSIVFTKQVFGGATSLIHAITVRSKSGHLHRVVIKKRLHEADWWADLFKNEAAALKAAARAGLRAPKLIGYSHSLGPSILMSRLDGRVYLKPHFPGFLQTLAEKLALIHDTSIRRVTGVHVSASHWKPPRSNVPKWTTHPAMWKRVFGLSNLEVPQQNIGFCHGDYHPGNILWRGTRLSGVVDWQGGSIGPIQRDLAHCRTNLALLEGVGVANDFLDRYRALTGIRLNAQELFDARDLMGFGPEPADVWDWRGFGRPDLTRKLLRRRFEAFASATAEARSGLSYD